MKKTIFLLVLPVLLMMLTVGSAEPVYDNVNSDSAIVYSNLIDKESKDLLESTLYKANINQRYIDATIRLICDYNEQMTTLKESDKEYMTEKDLFNFKKGFTSCYDDHIDYGGHYFQMKKWYNGRDYDDAYCRSLAFLLMQDFIHISSPFEKKDWGISNEDDFLYGDYAAMMNYDLIDIDESKYSTYFTLFHPVIYANKHDDLGEKIIEQWSEHGITFEEGKASLVTIWSAFDEQEETKIEHSHVGVLVDTENALLFIEKTNPLAPYQITKFSSLEQLKQYMIDTLTAYFISLELPVPEMVVLQNNKTI